MLEISNPNIDSQEQEDKNELLTCFDPIIELKQKIDHTRVINSSGQKLYNLIDKIKEDGCVLTEEINQFNDKLGDKEQIGDSLLYIRDNLDLIAKEKKQSWVSRINNIIESSINNEPSIEYMHDLVTEFQADISKNKVVDKPTSSKKEAEKQVGTDPKSRKAFNKAFEKNDPREYNIPEMVAKEKNNTEHQVAPKMREVI
jgi:hypothetical protein